MLVTFNVSDFAALHTEWLQNDLEHIGIAVAKRIPIGALVRRLMRLVHDFSAEDMVNKLIYLGKLP